MLLLHREDVLQHPPGRRVPRPEPGDDLLVGRDGDPLGDQILADHVQQVGASHVLRVTAPSQGRRIEIGIPPQLDDSCRYAIGVALLLAGVLEELGGDRTRVDPCRP